MRNGDKTKVNDAAWTTNQFGHNAKAGMTYEDEGCARFFEEFCLAFAVDDIDSCRSQIRRFVKIFLNTYLHYCIPRQSRGSPGCLNTQKV